MKRLFRRCFGTKRASIVSSVVAVALVTTTAAIAAWILTGTAASKGQVASAVTLTVAPATTYDADANCLPGASHGCAMTLKVSASGTGWSVTGASVATGTSLASASAGTCPNANFSFKSAYSPGGSQVALGSPIPVTTTPTVISIPNVVELAAAAPIACAGVGFDTQGAAGTGITLYVSPS